MAQPRKTNWLATAALLLPTALCPTGPAARAQETPALPASQVGLTDRYGDPLPPGAVARLGTTRLRRRKCADNVSLSPDGRLLASTCAWDTLAGSAALFLWDRHTGRLLRQLGSYEPYHGHPFHCYVFAPEGKTILSGDGEGRCLHLWDVATGKELLRWKGSGTGLWAMAISPRGTTLACAEGMGIIRLWDMTARGAPRTIAASGGGQLTHLAFTADGKHLAAVSDRDEVRLLELADGKILRRFTIDNPGRLALAPDGRTVATASAEGLRLWDVATGKARVLTDEAGQKLFELCFCADGKTLLALESWGEMLHLWDVASAHGRRVRLLGAGGKMLEPAGLSPDGKVLVVHDYDTDGVLRLWDVDTGRPLLDHPGHTRPPGQLAFSPDGRVLTSHAPGDAVIRWDVAGARPLNRMEAPAEDLSSNYAFMRLSADGRWAALNEWTHVRLYDTRSGEMVRNIRWTPGKTADLAFSRAGDRLAVAVGDGMVRIWEVPSGRPVRVIDTNKRGPAVSWVRFTPDGRALATGNGTMRQPWSWPVEPTEGPLCVHLWGAVTGEHLGVMKAESQRWAETAFNADWQCCFSPDGRSLFVSNDGHLLVWDVANRREAEPLPPDDEAGNQALVSGPVAVSPDGRLLARLYNNGKLRLWEVASGRRVCQLDGEYSSIVFGPDGRTLATGCQADASILLWELPALFRAGGTAPAPGPAPWQDLAGDVRRAYRAMGWLAADPGAVQLLGARLRPVPSPEVGQVPRLLHELDSPDFATRERAMQELEEIGEPARGQLEAACAGAASAEARRRAQMVLDKLHPRSAERLREVRAVQVLEYVGTPPARRLLQRLARGAPGARLTQEAKAALERLDARSSQP
jgi:WD40 repeat protein